MLVTIAVILVILWARGFLAFHVGGGLIHLLLVIAVIVVLYRLITGRRPVVYTDRLRKTASDVARGLFFCVCE